MARDVATETYIAVWCMNANSRVVYERRNARILSCSPDTEAWPPKKSNGSFSLSLSLSLSPSLCLFLLLSALLSSRRALHLS